MRRIPNSRPLDKALRETLRASDAVLKTLNKVAGELMEKGKYDEAHGLAARGTGIRKLREELVRLRYRWIAIKKGEDTPASVDQIGTAEPTPRRRLRKGQKTPPREFRESILQALREFGGSAYVGEILERVLALMRGHLKDVDYDVLRDGHPRWKSTAYGERSRMVVEGLIDKGTKKRVWRLTAEGKRRAQQIPDP